MQISIKYKDRWYKWTPMLQLTKDPSDVCELQVKYSYPSVVENQVVTGTDITVDSSSVSGNVVTMQLSGGVDGTLAKVAVKVDSADSNEVVERTFYVKIEEL